jgi:hypothetical protein
MAIIKHGNNALSSVTAFPSAVPTGKPVLLSTATASSSASIEFTSGIDSTYDVYQFEFINIHPATDNVRFEMNLSIDGGSNYNVTKTTAMFQAFHSEADVSNLSYEGDHDLAQSTSNQRITFSLGNGSDENFSGNMFLFSPSSIYVKHFISTGNTYTASNRSQNPYMAGYGNTTSAVNAIKFVMSSGTFDGTIKMYGISA